MKELSGKQKVAAVVVAENVEGRTKPKTIAPSRACTVGLTKRVWTKKKTPLKVWTDELN